MAKFMYVCEPCEEDNSETCGHSDPEFLRQLSDGSQICQFCFDDPHTWEIELPNTEKPDVEWKDLPAINLVAPVA